MKVKKTLKIRYIFLAFIFGTLSQFAHANIFLANTAYQNKDFYSAINEYRAAAEVGNIQAMYSLGVMYLNGEGTTPDAIEAGAWFAAAAANNFLDSKALMKKIATMLTKTEKQQLKEKALRYINDYGYGEKSKQYFPVIITTLLDEKVMMGEDIALGRIQGKDFSDIKVGASEQSILDSFTLQGPNEFVGEDESVSTGSRPSFLDLSKDPNSQIIYAEFTLSKNEGGVRDFTILNSLGYVEKRIQKFKKGKFNIATFEGQPIDWPMEFSFGMQQNVGNLWDLEGRRDRIRRAIRKVKNEYNKEPTPESAYKYATVLMVFDELAESETQLQNLLTEAAQKGLPEAQFALGKYLYRHQIDIVQGVGWISEAAKNGYMQAEYELGKLMVNSPWIEKNERNSLFWLNKAAKHDYYFATRDAASLYLFAEDKRLIDHDKALNLVQNFGKASNSDPQGIYISARAYRFAGEIPESVRLLKDAIASAKRNYAWDTNSWENLLENWTSPTVKMEEWQTQ